MPRVISDFRIARLPVGRGKLGMCPMPGIGGDYAADFRAILRWQPALVVSLTGPAEMDALDHDLGIDLSHAPPDWTGLPMPFSGVPDASTTARWIGLESRITSQLAAGRRVLFHGNGDCGRAGMAVLRLMVLHGEPPKNALARLRAVQPGAVDARGQQIWATR